MFVEVSALEVLVPFSIFGFIVVMAVVINYAYKLGQWGMVKLLNKLFGERK